MRLVLILFYFINLNFSANISKSEFYLYFKSNEKTSIQTGIRIVSNTPETNIRDAYLGVLIIKSAQYSNGIDRLKKFQYGKLLLEKAIEDDPLNIEFRFLRFVTQENCPIFLRYNNNLKEDKQFILKRYKSLDLIVKQEINLYSKESSLLSIEDLNSVK